MDITEETAGLRKLLAANIKERRGKLAISQEKLAELAGISVQTVNFIEGCRTWVSDKTLVKLARALRIDAYRLLCPSDAEEMRSPDAQASGDARIRDLRRLIKYDIDRRFDELEPERGGA